MSYLRLPRARRVLLLFLASSVLFACWPDLDLHVSRAFFRGGRFQQAESWWTRALHESVGYFVCVALAAIVGLYAFNKVSNRHVCGVDAKVVGYVFSVLLLGAGLTVNVVLKSGFGRARPRNVAQFGGRQQFTPAFVDGDECAANCSFSSGDGAGAYFAFALALALSRRRTMLVAAAAFGSAVSFARIASGAHFLSDTVVSFFVMWITSDVLYFYILLPRQGLARSATAAVAGLEGSAAWESQGLAAVPRYARLSGGDASHGPR
jgi:lipid A 4'-phosphatase